MRFCQEVIAHSIVAQDPFYSGLPGKNKYPFVATIYRLLSSNQCEKENLLPATLQISSPPSALFRVLAAVFFLILAVAPCAAASADEDPASEEKGVFDTIWGEAAMDTAYLGMWSYHFVDDNDEYQTTHHLLGLTYKGIFAGTFENSRADRSWGLGFQRDFYRSSWGDFNTEIGYRLGMMYGYEKMQLWDSGLFPLFQMYTDVRYKNIGLQFAWGGSAVTVGFLIRY